MLESRTGRSRIECTTDAVFLEKPQYYDLIIDLISYAPTEHRARPGRQLAIKEPYARRPTYRLSTIRFTWSDVKLTELDRILQLDADTNGIAHAHRASSPDWAWADAWGVYEDVCVVCAGLCSGLWRSGNDNGTGGSRDQ
ncbi:hypothetical protein EDB84DRAFT_361093 [Lactarius hengduanensis]|nr:hypothetical protein EDB84DRAFT_361093 [Lactarius hengduanensis]